MTFMRRISDSVPITVPQQPDIAPQPKFQPETNLGIAVNADLFEKTGSNNSMLIDQQPQNAVPAESDASQAQLIDASSMFSYIQTSVPDSDAHLAQLREKMNSLEAKKREIKAGITDEVEKSKEAKQAADTVAKALKNDEPIPDALLPILGSLGILGIIGGLPAIPVLGAVFGLFGGLSSEYKEKAKKAQAELERQAAESEMNAENMTTDLEDINSDMEAVRESIRREMERQAKANAPAKEFVYRGAMMEEQAFQEFVPDQTVIQQENETFSVSLDPTIVKSGEE